MAIPFWLVLFSTSCFASVLGLNISSAFNSAVTVYVMIPLLLIPQMILSGLLFSFDKLNSVISTKGKVPVLADMMASRWAYEALVVDQFVNNKYEKPFYTYEKIESQADFQASFLANELERKRKYIFENRGEKSDSIQQIIKKDIAIIQQSIRDGYFKKGLEKELQTEWTVAKFTPEFNAKLEEFLSAYRKFYQDAYNKVVATREAHMAKLETDKEHPYPLNEVKNRYYNESLADLVKNISEKDRIIEFEGKLYQQINPIFVDPKPAHALDYRAHFFAPQKNLFGTMVSTFLFNNLIIWVMTILLYCTLYFEWLRKLINSFEQMPGKISLPGLNILKKK